MPAGNFRTALQPDSCSRVRLSVLGGLGNLRYLYLDELSAVSNDVSCFP